MLRVSEHRISFFFLFSASIMASAQRESHMYRLIRLMRFFFASSLLATNNFQSSTFMFVYKIIKLNFKLKFECSVSGAHDAVQRL